MQALINKYNLIPHPEGGYYREAYRSGQTIYSSATGKKRNALTHIYFLLLEGQFSRFHKVLHDEIWNFYEGNPLKLIQYNGEDVAETIIGTSGGEFAAMVAGGIYQAAEPTGAYSLVGCTVAPGFEFEDFSFLDDDPKLKMKFIDKYPHYHRLV